MRECSRKAKYNPARRYIEYMYRREGWIMVPADYEASMSITVTLAFDEMDISLKDSGVVVTKCISCLIKNLKEKIIVRLCSTAKKWLPSKKRGGVGSGVTPVVAERQITHALKSIFNTLHHRIADHSLIDTSDQNQKLVVLELDIIEDRILERMSALLEEWV